MPNIRKTFPELDQRTRAAKYQRTEPDSTDLEINPEDEKNISYELFTKFCKIHSIKRTITQEQFERALAEYKAHYKKQIRHPLSTIYAWVVLRNSVEDGLPQVEQFSNSWTKIQLNYASKNVDRAQLFKNMITYFRARSGMSLESFLESSYAKNKLSDRL